ncbi:hypothetical protein B0H13DRAFT_1873534 [Mycena leptocephala]|nr:hypothetical protein B0H13DRAFT_1873534 [Mycena leptocephala]
MGPVQLPPLNNVVNLPSVPRDPPIDTDVLNAVAYRTNTKLAYGAPFFRLKHLIGLISGTDQNLVTPQAMSEAVKFEHSVVSAAVGDGAVADALRPLKDDIDRIETSIKELTTTVNTCLVISAKSYNSQVGDGSIGDRQFEIVPFPDETDPVASGLPLLNTLQVIQALTPAETREYYKGYCRPAANAVIPHHDQRKVLIRVAIGCAR